MKEQYYDKLLRIKTGGKQGFASHLHYHRYEPTPYAALERLFEHLPLDRENRLVDFGCGKGRLNFFAHHLFHLSVVGVEMDETYYHNAQENLESYRKGHRVSEDQIQFQCVLAENYRIHPTDDHFYFFNPFSVQIFMTVIGNVLRSYERDPRNLTVILYYPTEEYVFFLENDTPFTQSSKLRLDDLYANNPYERFLIYQLRI